MYALNWYAQTAGNNFVRMQEIAEESLVVVATDNQDDNVQWYVFVPVTDLSYLSVNPALYFFNFSVIPTITALIPWKYGAMRSRDNFVI